MKGTLVEDNLTFRPHLGFHWSDFPKNCYITFQAHTLHRRKIGCDRYIIVKFTCKTFFLLDHILSSILRIFLKIHVCLHTVRTDILNFVATGY